MGRVQEKKSVFVNQKGCFLPDSWYNRYLKHFDTYGPPFGGFHVNGHAQSNFFYEIDFVIYSIDGLSTDLQNQHCYQCKNHNRIWRWLRHLLFVNRFHACEIISRATLRTTVPGRAGIIIPILLKKSQWQDEESHPDVLTPSSKPLKSMEQLDLILLCLLFLLEAHTLAFEHLKSTADKNHLIFTCVFENTLLSVAVITKLSCKEYPTQSNVCANDIFNSTCLQSKLGLLH